MICATSTCAVYSLSSQHGGVGYIWLMDSYRLISRSIIIMQRLPLQSTVQAQSMHACNGIHFYALSRLACLPLSPLFQMVMTYL